MSCVLDLPVEVLVRVAQSLCVEDLLSLLEIEEFKARLCDNIRVYYDEQSDLVTQLQKSCPMMRFAEVDMDDEEGEWLRDVDSTGVNCVLYLLSKPDIMIDSLNKLIESSSSAPFQLYLSRRNDFVGCTINEEIFYTRKGKKLLNCISYLNFIGFTFMTFSDVQIEPNTLVFGEPHNISFNNCFTTDSDRFIRFLNNPTVNNITIKGGNIHKSIDFENLDVKHVQINALGALSDMVFNNNGGHNQTFSLSLYDIGVILNCKFGNLTHLSLEKIQMIAKSNTITNISTLKNLRVIHSNIGDFEIFDLPNLTELYFKGNFKSESFPFNAPNLESLYADFEFNEIPTEFWFKLAFDYKKITIVQLLGASGKCENYTFTSEFFDSFSIKVKRNFEFINCHFKSLKKLDISKTNSNYLIDHHSIEKAIAKGFVTLKDLDLILNTDYTYLSTTPTVVSETAISSLKSLVKQCLFKSEIDFHSGNLESLILRNLNLLDVKLDITMVPHLYDLLFVDCTINDLVLSNLQKLKTLICYNVNFSKIIADNVSLKSIRNFSTRNSNATDFLRKKENSIGLTII